MARPKTRPLYQHHCDTCRYMGTSAAPCLDMGDRPLDFYVCDSGEHRSLIARYGDGDGDYMSMPLLVCQELTRLDLFFLANGLELRPSEQVRLLQRLADMYRRTLTRADYGRLMTEGELTFGRGNVLFPY